MGLVQYCSPTLQFLIGLVVYHEGMTHGRWVGFIIVWLALAIFSIDAVRNGRNFATSEE
jgi:chloramphenicol-sensitive protein RarD